MPGVCPSTNMNFLFHMLFGVEVGNYNAYIDVCRSK